MGGDGLDDKGLGGFPSPGGKSDHRDDGNTWGGRGVGIPPVGGENGNRGTSPHNRINWEMAGDHIV